MLRYEYQNGIGLRAWPFSKGTHWCEICEPQMYLVSHQQGVQPETTLEFLWKFVVFWFGQGVVHSAFIPRG